MLLFVCVTDNCLRVVLYFFTVTQQVQQRRRGERRCLETNQSESRYMSYTRWSQWRN